jgi:hypothetical protein
MVAGFFLGAFALICTFLSGLYIKNLFFSAYLRVFKNYTAELFSAVLMLSVSSSADSKRQYLNDQK